MRHLAAIVKSVSGTSCEIDIDGTAYPCAIASHLLSVVPGQRVAVLDGGSDAGCLVIAAWPLDDGNVATPLRFDPASGTVHIQAARLNLGALSAIELQCGEARIRLSLDGRVQIEGNDVLSAAIGSNRIEGASIDLN